MKQHFFKPAAAWLALAPVLSLLLAGCGDRLSSRYSLKLPETPEVWVSLLGEPHWRLEWVESSGKKRTTDITPGKSVEIELPSTWANPVSAWPYWPEYGLIPGFFKPAGALFPFDIEGSNSGKLCLTWKAGPDAVFYWELASASSGGVKIPANFDWPRFRELFETGVLSEAVCKDPWLINWRFIAEKTMDSNFDRRRLVPQAVSLINIPVAPGPWYGTSPFAEALYFAEDEMPVFPANDSVNVWISREGILRCNSKAWIFTAWE